MAFSIPTVYFVQLCGKTYRSQDPLAVSFFIPGTINDGTGIFAGPHAQAARGAFALIKARCEIPSVNPDSEMHLFDQVLKELDNAGT